MRLRALSGVAFAVAISFVAAGLAPSAAAEPSDPGDAPSGPTISGTVTLEAGAPAEWLGTVQVSAQSIDGEHYYSAELDPVTGEYALPNLPANAYRLQFSADPTWTENGVITPNLIPEYFNDTTDWTAAELISVDSTDIDGVDATLAQGRSISGVVELPQDVPAAWMQGVTVNASAGSGASQSASVDPETGQYTITGLLPDAYRVHFYSSSFWVGDERVTPNLVAEYFDGTTRYADATLVDVTTEDASGVDASLSSGRSLSGTVTLPESVPTGWLNGVMVSANSADGSGGGYSSTFVDPSTGAYELVGLPSGSYKVQFQATSYWADGSYEHPNLVAEYFDNAADWSAASSIDLSEGDVEGIDAELSEGRSISGRVTLPSDADPEWIEDITVSASGITYASSKVDPETGMFAIVGLAPDTYEVKFAADSYCPPGDTCANLVTQYWQNAISPSQANRVDVTQESKSGIDASLYRGTEISGTVSLPSDAPADWLRGVYVSAQHATLPAVSVGQSVDPLTGAYTIDRLPAGDYHVRFSAFSYWSDEGTVELNLGAEYYDDAFSVADATIVSTTAGNRSSVDAALDYGGAISGEVDVSSLRQMFPNSGFGLRLTDTTGLTEFYGFGDPMYADMIPFQMSNLAPGTYRLAIETSEWDSETETLRTTSSQFLRFGSQSSITIRVGETKQNLRLVARKPDAVLSGTVITAGLSNAPIDGILASALVYERVGNEWARMPAARFDTNTDGLTPYRIAVPSGTYTVGFETDFATTEVSAAEQWWRGKQSLASATPIVVGSGAEASGINGALGGAPFSDTAGHDFYAEIAWLASTGVTRGWTMPDGSVQFRPQQPILRGEMAAFLYRLAGEPEFNVPAKSPFVDVSTDHVFFKEIAWLAAEEISRGWDTPRGVEFRAESSTARDVMAAFLYRYQGEPAYSPEGASPFRDVAAGRVFYPEIRWLAAEGISTGWDVGAGCREYRPMQNVLRSEMAAFLFRMENGGTLPITSSSCRG